MARPVNGSRRRGYALSFAAGFGVALLVGADDAYAGLERLGRVLSDAEAHYERPVSLADLADAALRGVAGALDENSAYFTPEEWRALRDRETGLRVGVGIQATPAACGLVVEALERHGPAERAGLAAGDCVVEVDAQPASLASLEGPEGTAVRLAVQRGGTTSAVAVIRGRPRPPAVEVTSLPGRRVHVRVHALADPVVGPLAERLPRVEPSPRGMVLDLRGNPGGRVEEAAALVDLFVSEGTIVTTRRRVGGDTVLAATATAADWTFPVAVLVDGNTASAAEIVAGALRDLGRARVYGSRTYGKGSVQRVFAYDDGAALKLTVGRYYLPGGAPILDHTGLEPDVPVTAPAPPPDGTDADPVLARALADLGASGGR